MEILHAQMDLIEAVQDFFKKFDHIPSNEKSMMILLAEERFLKIKQVLKEEQTQPEYLQGLLQGLMEDIRVLNETYPEEQTIDDLVQEEKEEKSMEELLAEEQRNFYEKKPIFFEDEEYSIQVQEYLDKCASEDTPDLPIPDSLKMGDGHIDTTPETETISVETLV